MLAAGLEPLRSLPRLTHRRAFDQSRRPSAQYGLVHALDNISLEIEHGAFVTVIGPSGCGKTTLLNLLAGFERPSSGEVLLEGEAIERPGADRGVVFQEYALFPWLTLRQNVEYGPRERGIPAPRVREITDRTIAMVKLAGAENRYPHELSGGMRQRAAIARVLVNDPKILLMDGTFCRPRCADPRPPAAGGRTDVAGNPKDGLLRHAQRRGGGACWRTASSP